MNDTMAHLIQTAKETLSYPLYACDFDPVDSSRLVVAGGGGAGSNGVGNKIVSAVISSPLLFKLIKVQKDITECERFYQTRDAAGARAS